MGLAQINHTGSRLTRLGDASHDAQRSLNALKSLIAYCPDLEHVDAMGLANLLEGVIQQLQQADLDNH